MVTLLVLVMIAGVLKSQFVFVVYGKVVRERRCLAARHAMPVEEFDIREPLARQELDPIVKDEAIQRYAKLGARQKHKPLVPKHVLEILQVRSHAAPRA